MTSYGENRNILESVPVKEGGKYYASCKVRVTKVPDGDKDIWYTAQIRALVGGGQALIVAIMPHITIEDEWVDCAGDLVTPSGCESVTLTAMSEEGVEFEVKDIEFNEIIPNKNWKEEANDRIERIRKGDININVSIADNFDPDKVIIKVEQLTHAFPFGSCIQASKLTADDAEGSQYREFFCNNFSWATIENAMKWRFMEPIKGRPVYSLVDKTLDALKSNGITIRGHCITWAKEKKVLPWVQKEDEEGVKEAVDSRIADLVNKYRGTISQWDVCNEQLHGDYYERMTNDREYMDWMFRKVHELDPRTPLCLNDYDVCSKGIFTTAYKRQASEMMKRNVPLSFMGIQSHMSVYPDPDLLNKRLEVMSEAGVPLFITELDVRQDDLEMRGQGYEDIMRLYFSHPNIHGIVLWGFLEGTVPDEIALAEGKKHIKWNEAGKKVEQLLKREWLTCKKLRPNSNNDVLKVRGFHGKYHMTLQYEGKEQWSHDFTLDEKKDVNIEIKI